MIELTDPVFLYFAAIAAGFVIQTLLHGPARMAFDAAIGLIAGFAAESFAFFLPLGICLGITLKIITTKYLHCLALLIVYIAIGFFISYFIF